MLLKYWVSVSLFISANYFAMKLWELHRFWIITLFFNTLLLRISCGCKALQINYFYFMDKFSLRCKNWSVDSVLGVIKICFHVQHFFCWKCWTNHLHKMNVGLWLELRLSAFLQNKKCINERVRQRKSLLGIIFR